MEKEILKELDEALEKLNSEDLYVLWALVSTGSEELEREIKIKMLEKDEELRRI